RGQCFQSGGLHTTLDEAQLDKLHHEFMKGGSMDALLHHALATYLQQNVGRGDEGRRLHLVDVCPPDIMDSVGWMALAKYQDGVSHWGSVAPQS
ncbi:hypothetical protein CYMTET_30678, partial [Cymbomonas tetramitiformis]